MEASNEAKQQHEILTEYISKAPDDVKAAWSVYSHSFDGLIAEVARLTMKVKELSTKSE